MSLADSILQTASMTRCVSIEDTAAFQVKPKVSRMEAQPLPGADLSRIRSGGGWCARVGFVDLAKLAFAVAGNFKEFLGQFDGFFF